MHPRYFKVGMTGPQSKGNIIVKILVEFEELETAKNAS